MVARLKKFFLKRYLPRWMVLLFDINVVLLTFVLAYILRFNFNMEEVGRYLNLMQIVIILPVFLVSFILVKSYSGILRLSTTEDIARIIFSLSIGSSILLAVTLFNRFNPSNPVLFVPLSVIIIQFGIASNMLLVSRILAKAIYNDWFGIRKNVKRVMIYGAGNLGQVTRNALISDPSEKIKLVGYIDNNVFLQNKRTAGVPIYSVKQAFEKIVPRNNIKEVILAIDNEESITATKRKIVDLCLPLNVVVKEVPSVNKWINGELNAREIKQVKIEDLLGRDSIQLDRQKIKEGVKDAVILVAGAAGSIGSEIVNQLISFNAHHVVLLDKAESELYDLQNDLRARYSNPKFTVIVGDVTHRHTLRKLFEKYTPSIVINAAAYKHVPLMEEFPGEAVSVNIGGTLNLADLSVEYGVKRFVFISTDKAVNPTNVMGATKRISEIYVQSLAHNPKVATQFITTRFGNVLGSNGSVVPLFKKQIESGGPVTVTHKDITRFFMTIPEACQLVLEACFMGKGGEIFIFDMGEPVRIYDLAKKMIFLSGYIPEEDIKIEFTGLRPGEKLYEELMKSQEGVLPTYNDKIMIGKNVEHDYNTVNNQIKYLLYSLDTITDHRLVAQLKNIVPEYVSMNSPYSAQHKLKLVKPKKQSHGKVILSQ